MSTHHSTEELADRSAGLLSAAHAREVDQHLEHCADCASRLRSVDQVSTVLAAQPRPSMPDPVFARLHQTLTELTAEAKVRQAEPTPASEPDGSSQPGGMDDPGESAGRIESGRPGEPDPPAEAQPIQTSPKLQPPRPSLGPFSATVTSIRRRTGRVALRALAACAVAGAVGFGGYVLSASSGQNEPSADAPVISSGTQLGSAAAGDRGSLSAHRFSDAWNCARKATNGRIIGIQSSVVDGRKGLLVYLAGPKRSTRVVFISGCPTGTPSAGPSAMLPSR